MIVGLESCAGPAELGAIVSTAGADRVIFSLDLKEGRPTYCYNFLGLEEYKIEAPQAVAAGKATIRVNFDYDGGGLGKGGMATILVNGEKVASGRVGGARRPSSVRPRRDRSRAARSCANARCWRAISRAP